MVLKPAVTVWPLRAWQLPEPQQARSGGREGFLAPTRSRAERSGPGAAGRGGRGAGGRRGLPRCSWSPGRPRYRPGGAAAINQGPPVPLSAAIKPPPALGCAPGPGGGQGDKKALTGAKPSAYRARQPAAGTKRREEGAAGAAGGFVRAGGWGGGCTCPPHLHPRGLGGGGGEGLGWTAPTEAAAWAGGAGEQCGRLGDPGGPPRPGAAPASPEPPPGEASDA